MLCGSLALAEENTWSFEENPQPGFNERTPEENQLLDDAYKTGPPIELFCETVVQTAYGIYQNCYPDFQ